MKQIPNYSSISLNRDFNPPGLKNANRMCVYRCSDCGRLIFKSYDLREGNRPESCENCNKFLDPDMDIILDTWNMDEFPSARVTIDGIDPKTKRFRYLAWFTLTCPQCGKDEWIAWRFGRFDFSTCICQAPPEVKAPPKKTEVVVKAAVEKVPDLIIESVLIPGEMVPKLKDFCFKHDLSKKDAIVKALRELVEEKPTLIISGGDSKATTSK